MGLITTNLFTLKEFKDNLSSEYYIESRFSCCEVMDEGLTVLIVGYLAHKVNIYFNWLLS